MMMDYQQQQRNDDDKDEKGDSNQQELDTKDDSDDADKKKSVFDERTEEASASQYFQFYGYLAQQQNMMQDYVRTSTYQKAVLSNLSDFKDKVVMDVGAGSGILSFFAAQAGAKRIYAVEASSMALHCEALVKANGYEDRIKVVAGKVEDIELPELVDTIISEPMGYMLLNERMLESFLHAKKFLKPGGKMYPSRGDLHIAPFCDEALYMEQCTKANFWCQESFHGVNLSSLRQQALKEYFRQPVVDTFHVGILLAPSVQWTLDFTKWHEEGLHRIEIPLEYVLPQTSYVHGLAFWFDVAFIGTNQTVWLSTGPTEPLTHWYQVRCLLEKPILCRQGGSLTGYVRLTANKRQSYDVEICLEAEGVLGAAEGGGGLQTSKNTLDLKNPCFRYTGQPVQPPPGYNSAGQQQVHAAAGGGEETLTSPTDAYWQSVLAAAAQQNQLVENGTVLMNGNLDAVPAAAVVGINPAAASNLLNGGRFLPMDGLVTTPISAAAAAGIPIGTAGGGVCVPTIGNVVNLLPTGQVVPLSPTAGVPPPTAAFGTQQQHQHQQQHFSLHHPQLGSALVQGACLPVSGAPSSSSVNYHPPPPPHDYFMTSAPTSTTSGNSNSNQQQQQQQRFAAYHHHHHQPTSSSSSAAAATNNNANVSTSGGGGQKV